MDFFRGLIERILRDMTLAQHEANLLSASLVPLYRDPEAHDLPPGLSFFPIPNAAISSVAFTLKFGVEEVAELVATETPPAIQDAARAMIQALRDRFGQEATATPPSTREWAILAQAIANFLLVEWMQSEATEVDTEWVSKICRKLHSFLTSLPEPAIELSPAEINDVVGEYLVAAIANPPSRSSRHLAAMLKSQQLQHLAPETLCSIAVRCNLRNFEHASVENDPTATRLIQQD